MKLIVGLGNPGEKYKETPHNAGFMALDYLLEVFQLDEFRKMSNHKAKVAIIHDVPIKRQVEGDKMLLAKPQTFMNLSGQAVFGLMQYYKIPIEDLIVIYDDADLPYGTLRIRPSGSDGGHNGLASVIKYLASEKFIRIRLGIKPAEHFQGRLEDYVLKRLNEKERSDLNMTTEKIPSVIDLIFKEGVEKAMNEFN